MIIKNLAKERSNLKPDSLNNHKVGAEDDGSRENEAKPVNVEHVGQVHQMFFIRSSPFHTTAGKKVERD